MLRTAPGTEQIPRAYSREPFIFVPLLVSSTLVLFHLGCTLVPQHPDCIPDELNWNLWGDPSPLYAFKVTHVIPGHNLGCELQGRGWNPH